MIANNGTSARGQVAVIGGSAAGFFVAGLLAQNGLDVRLFERAERLDPAPRTLIVTSRLRDVLDGWESSSVINEIHRFELFADGRVATVDLRSPDLIVERSTLVRELANKAEEFGVQTRFGCRFVGFSAGSGEMALRLGRNGQSEDHLVTTLVGADGAMSRVAREGGWPRLPTVPLIQAIIELPPGIAQDTARVWFRPDETPYFYWLIPQSGGRAAVGMIAHGRQDSRVLLDRFLCLQGMTALEYQAACIPRYRGWVPVKRTLSGADVYLVGDAACHVKVTTVGGVVTGFDGARGVARDIAEGSKRDLRRLRRELDLHLWIRTAIDGWSQDEYSRLLDLLTRKVRRELGTRPRDGLNGLLWRLFVAEPRLGLLGFRSILLGGALSGRQWRGTAAEPVERRAEPVP